MLNEAMNVVAARAFERARRDRHAQGDPRGRRARPRDRPHRRGARRPARRAAARGTQLRAGDSLLLEPRSRLRLRAHPQGRGRGARPRGGPRHRLRRHRRSRPADRGRSATPSSCRTCTPTCSPSTSSRRPRGSCSTARPAAARRSSPRRWPTRWPRRSPSVDGHASEGRSFFLNIKGPELLNKYVGETERHIRLVFQRAREKASRGHAGHRVLRRDGLAVPHPRLRRVQRRREHDRAAAAQRDRRRRGPRERHRDRRLEPRGHDRPGDPAPGPARREDQDRAPRRGGAPATSSQVPHPRPAAARRRPRRARRRPRRHRAGR